MTGKPKKMPMLVASKLSRDQFVEVLGGVFEHSPWVAAGAWEAGPFRTRKQLHDVMLDVVGNATDEAVLALLRAHPDLATRLTVTEFSAKEQEGAGLGRLTQAEADVFAAINRTYTDKFGFPFILAVKGKNKDDILSAMRTRVLHSVAEEKETALAEIAKITGFRLEQMLDA